MVINNVSYEDLLTKEVKKETVTKIILNEGHITYIDKDSKVNIIYDKNSCEIIRKGESVTIISLLKDNVGKCTINSAYGQIVFDTKLINIIKTTKYLEVEYQLLEQKNIVSHLKYRIEF